MLKTRFPFLYRSTSLDTKTLTMASNHNFQSCLSIHHLAPRHIFQFSIFAAGFSFTFGNFANYCVILLNVPLNDRNKKKRTCLRFPGNHWRLEVPLSHWFTVSGGNIIFAWHELFATFFKLKSCIWFWEEYNHFERIYRIKKFDRFCQISVKHSRNNDKQKCVGKFWYLASIYMGDRHRQKYRYNKWFVINRNGLIVFWRTIYLISRDLFKIKMDKSPLVKWNIQTRNGLYNSETV